MEEKGQLRAAFTDGRRGGGSGGQAAKMKFAQFLMKNGSVFGSPKQVERFSKFCPSPLSMKQFLDFGECPAPARSVGRSVIAGRLSFPPLLMRLDRHLKQSRRLFTVTADFKS